MLQESSVLQPEEQDRLGVLLANLEAASVVYETSDFTSQTAQNILDVIDGAVSVMGEHGLLHGRVDKPWDNQTKEQTGLPPNMRLERTGGETG